MTTRSIEVPEDLLALLQQSRLGARSAADQVKIALAVHLFQAGIVSVGRAAELAGEPRATFELLLGDLGVPPVRYQVSDYDREAQVIQRISRTSS